MVITPPSACSAVSRALDEPFAGTAATATTWLCLEQPGPWGREALVGSHLGGGVGARLVARSAGTGVRVVLVRRPGAHPGRHRVVPRRVLLAHTVPGAGWLRSGSLLDPRDLLDLDLAALGAGAHGGFGEPVVGPVLLVCTNGRRDVCCAVRGRPVAGELAAEFGDAVWEATHLGGHRFAPTGLLLPTGYAYGGLDAGRGRELLVGGEVVLRGCRGRSTWVAAGQVAELAVRALTHTVDPEVLHVRSCERDEDGDRRVVVWHVDGRGWRVTVTERDLGVRPVSCGVNPAPATALVVSRID
ncbi:hypothetical protein DFQ13_104525 [Actinokineospora spheciospongiae]|nr:hypothetical protein DFQ13_104525 [Actinokineospora spheciospongiae]